MLNTQTVKDIIQNLEKTFPLKLAEDWDKVGVQLGNLNKQVNNILVVMDLNKEAVDFAETNKIDLIITFHPFLFNDEDFNSPPYQKYKANLFQRLKKDDITLYSMHTIFDKAPQGMSMALSARLQLPVKPIKGLNHGALIEFNQSLNNLIDIFAKKFNLKNFGANISNPQTVIKNFVIIPGSGSLKEMQLAWKNNNIDLVITSDIKWSDQITLNEERINFMEISHFVEVIFIDYMYKFLTNEFSDSKIYKLEQNEIMKYLNNF